MNNDMRTIARYKNPQTSPGYAGHANITLKDVKTAGREPDRIRRWMQLTRQVIDALY